MTNERLHIVEAHPIYFLYQGEQVFEAFKFNQKEPLSLKDQQDVVEMYQDALDHYGVDE